MILGIAPFVVLLLIAIWQEPGVTLFALGSTVAIVGCVILSCYGAWELGWLAHCGDFWESWSCDGKVITNQ